MKLLLVTILSFLAVNASANCPIDFDNTGLCAQLEWTQGPVLNQKSHFKVTFWEKNDVNQTQISPKFDVDIFSWMIMDNGHSHGGPALTYNEVTPGVFISKDARFFMGRMKGSWQVKIVLEEGNLVLSEKAIDVVFE
jgi:hypothetical protein